ncbi:oxaloacetate decarboxylase, partial [Pantoea sp. SIMBA_133]
ADDVAPAKKAAGPETYTVEVNGKEYVVAVNEGGEISQIEGQGGASAPAAAAAPAAGEGEPVVEPLGGNLWKLHDSPTAIVEEG